MAKITRTKELWHIPKRGSVHQTVFMVYLLTWEKFLQKSWSSGKQEMIASEMGKAGLTEKGGAISHQSVRTLLANVPKYLGFVYIDNSSTPPKVMVTDMGYELIKFHNIQSIPTHKNLKEYALSKDILETSEIFNKQMLKLIITNPSINNDCQNILVFPFRMTLRLLMELDYLDKEELGYILFHAKAEDEYPLLVEKIKNFRSLAPEQRQSEIDAYEKTEEGKLTLVKAPTSGYYMYLCYSTGLCARETVKVNKTKSSKLPAIKLLDKNKVQSILNNFNNAEVYDFKNNSALWKEYFSNPKRLFPPFDVEIKTKSQRELLVTVIKDGFVIGSDVVSVKRSSFTIPVFESESYEVVVHEFDSGKELFREEARFSRSNRVYFINEINIKENAYTDKEIIDGVRGMFDDSYEGFDEEYYKKLKVIERVLGATYLDNRRKGGRLEYLFYELLNHLKSKKVIDEVYWFGHVGRYGICEPAPGGKEGNPDIVFEIDNFSFVLELTTIRGNRAQWGGSEASSVPDHIAKYAKDNPSRSVIGIFCAPSIHTQLQQNLVLNARNSNTGMLFRSCVDFAKYLGNISRQELLTDLLDETKTQLGQ